MTFWIAQLLGWGLYVLTNFALSVGILPDATASAQLTLFGQKLIKGGIGLGISLILHQLLSRLWARGASLRTVGLAAFGGSLVLGAAWLLLVRLAYRQPPFAEGFLRDILSHVFVLVAWSAVYVTVRTRGELQVERERALRATALANEAKLRMLRYQVNPHFFFNALNSIRALVDESPARARETITQLSELFRYSLMGQDETTLGDELAAIRNYLAIQKIRFEDKIEVTEDIDPDAEKVRMPSFLIHPLVENAVKHGLNVSAPPLRIEVRAALQGGMLVVEIRNSGRLGAASDLDPPVLGTGTGVANVVERLRQRYPGRHRFRLDDGGGWVTARLEIPS